MICQFESYQKKEVLHHHLNLGHYNSKDHPINITSAYLTKDGKPWLPVMGEVHFSRIKRSAWSDELSKMKAGGVEIISTYLFWIYHEEIEGELDFSGDNDIRAFVELCQKEGLYVILRIGPWAHGECRNGGFPDWILEKGIPLRTNDPAYLELAKGWYGAIFNEVQGLLYEDGGPVIGVQLENELTDGAEHLKKLKELAIETGFRLPLYTVTGWNSAAGARIPVDEVFPVFGAYPDAPWEEGKAPLPLSPHYRFSPIRNDAAIGADLLSQTAEDGWHLPYERYPFATCELGPGQQSTYLRRVHISPMDAYALSLVKLGSGNNLIGYYMYHGGSNQTGKRSTFQESRATHYPNDYPIINYDFDTCLSEYGEARPQYGMLNLLHLFVEDFGERLAAMDYLPMTIEKISPEDRKTPRMALRTDGRSGFVFVNHHQRHLALNAWKNLEIKALDVNFPPIDVTEDTAFFFPVRMEMGNRVLNYATAQPLCHVGSDWYFVRIPGIDPVYEFEDGVQFSVSDDGQRNCESDAAGISVKDLGGLRIITIDFDRAVFLRRLKDQLVLGDHCNLYWSYVDHCIKSIERGDQKYYLLPNGTGREDQDDGKPLENRETEKNVEDQGIDKIGDIRGTGIIQERTILDSDFHQARVEIRPCPPVSNLPFLDELELGGKRPIHWFEIDVSGKDGFIEIRQPYDIAMIFADGKLAADSFSTGEIWRIPADLLYGKHCILALTDPNPDVYHESDGWKN